MSAGTDGVTMAEKAHAGWPRGVPDWVAELAAVADARGLKPTAKCIGYSFSVVSQIIHGSYPGDIGRVEQMVRGALMSLEVECPAFGEIGRDQCLRWQRAPFIPTNAARARLRRVCNETCPNYRKGNNDA